MRPSHWASLLCAVAIGAGALSLGGCGRSGAAGDSGKTCADNDAACLRANASAAEAEANRLLSGAPADNAAAQPQQTAQANAGSGGLADGSYDCGGGYTYHAMGNVDIQGGKFRWRPFGEVHDGFAPYSVDAGGHIHWGGPFSGLDDPPSRIVDSTKESFGFNVQYQGSSDALINTMSCNKM